MKFYLRDVFLLAGIFCISVGVAHLATSEPAPPVAWTTHAYLTRVKDGDTVEIEVRRKLTIRLKDCWAPEKNTDAGRRSLDHLERLVRPDDEIIVRIEGSDRDLLGDVLTFSRFVGDVWLPGAESSFSDQQVEAGHAFRTKAEQQAAAEDQE